MLGSSSALDHSTAPDSALSDKAQADMSADGDIAVARRVLRVEAEALMDMAAGLDDSFARAVKALAGITGRVVVTGMGKSGHIARKIAATLASTGTPALWVHPGEASHGDLGMIARDDAVIALSNSGDTAELCDIVAYAKRFRIPLIGITRRTHSSLAEQSDVALILPQSPEACPLGLAPTTSTTLMLALGDALAVARCHRLGIRVVPLIGPSSIILAVMASGLNGQSFAFNGYLPVKPPERARAIRTLERRATGERQSQVFIEAPYRNAKLLGQLLEVCAPDTRLTLAVDITSPQEYIRTLTVREWRSALLPEMDKRPAIFILG